MEDIIIPAWAGFGLMAALFSALMMLMQERFKIEPLAIAYWNKVGCACAMLPFVYHYGMSTNPIFYLLLALQSVLWVISDVLFFRGVSEEGAGVIARMMPLATVASFLLWFVVDWKLAFSYAAHPVHSLAILAVLSLSAYCASRLKKCTISMRALRRVWFVIFAAVVGSIAMKYTTQFADIKNGAYSFVFAQAWMMIAMWSVYYILKKPISTKTMFGIQAIRSGLVVGCVSSFAALTTIYALYHIDNPAYVSSVKFLDSVIILGVYRFTGRPITGNVLAGLGLVACAALLIVIKAHA